jgi:ubiquinone/menaquinone biosynthesis C-methylase UbiE
MYDGGMSDDEIKKLVQQQFGAVAQNYVESPERKTGADLQRLVQYASLRGDERVLDVATGGGHTALAFAPHVREVVATDLTPRMLAAATAFLAESGAKNVRTELADAESLPYPDGSFDVVTSRIAPHHFAAPQRFITEAARVLRPGGRLLLDDNMSPEEEDLDTFMNRYEKWRDPSHVRSWRKSEWRNFMSAAGLDIEHEEPLSHKVYYFLDWTARMHMPENERDALQAWLLGAPSRFQEYFRITVEDNRVQSLCATFSILVARRPLAHIPN